MSIVSNAANADSGMIAASLVRARALLAAGKAVEAAQVYESILAVDASQTEALNALAIRALRGGDFHRAQRLLEQALSVAPNDPLTLNNLAQAHQTVGDAEKALTIYRQVLAVKPNLYAARLSAARLLEERGEAEQALPLYFRAITDAQQGGRWLSPDSTPPSLQPLVQHAMLTVNEGRRRLYGQLMEPLRLRFGREAMARVDYCLDVYLGDRRCDFADPLQRPRFLYFPGLPALPYLDKAQVPEMEALEASTGIIGEELSRLLTASAGREAVFLDESVAAANLTASSGKPSWDGYYFYRHGERRDDNCDACPGTTRAIEALPLCRVRAHGPEVLFSVLSPGTHILPHVGVTNTRIVGHLGLIVPPECGLRVAGQQYEWQVGQSVLFDDTYQHEAWNRSDATRVVLIFDLWNPYLTGAERAALTELIGAIGDFRSAADRF